MRLGKKLYLLEHRTKTHDLAMCWSVAGIILMILDAEFNQDKNCIESIVLRSGCTITSFISMVFIIRYNFDERKIFKIDNSLQSWHTVLLSKSTIYFLAETFFLFLHPIPFEILNLFWPCVATTASSSSLTDSSSSFTSSSSQISSSLLTPDSGESLYHLTNQSASDPGGGVEEGGGTGSSTIPSISNQSACVQPYTMMPITYLTLVIVMITRLYLPLRSFVLHSDYFNSSRVQMLGALNHMNTGTLCSENITYIVRHAMAIRSGSIIGLSILFIWQTFAWILYTSEFYYTLQYCGEPFKACDALPQDLKVQSHFDAIYLIPITMMSIGYGDYYPVSPYGKLISVCSGICGIVGTAVLVAILSKKLTMTRRERYLHRAMIETKFQSDVEHRAACVLQSAWRSFKKGRKKNNLLNKKIAKLNGTDTETQKLCSNGDPEANYLGSGVNQSDKSQHKEQGASKPRDRAASLISISATPSYERAFLLSVKRFKAARIRLNKVHDGMIEIVDFGIMQQQYMDTLLRVERQNNKIEGQLKTLGMKLRLKEDTEKCLLQQISEINSKLNKNLPQITSEESTTNN